MRPNPKTAPSESFDLNSALAYQINLLKRVSRTFSLTISQLPPPLVKVITNAYLLCRAADTIEDDPSLTNKQKKHYGEVLVSVISGKDDPSYIAQHIAPYISFDMSDGERELMRELPLIIRIFRTFTTTQQQAIERCVRVMWQGMYHYLNGANQYGTETYTNMDTYAYYVSSVVGEMLTEIFCEYSPTTAKNKEIMTVLAISFGKGLQFSNFLQDQWEDRLASRCWLPLDIFEAHDVDFKTLKAGQPSEAYISAQNELIGITHAHLKKAFEYTKLISAGEPGIRRFCFWIVYLSALTLRNIYRKPNFKSVEHIRPTKSNIIAMIAMSKLFIGNDYLLTQLFQHVTRRLPLREPPSNWQWLGD